MILKRGQTKWLYNDHFEATVLCQKWRNSKSWKENCPQNFPLQVIIVSDYYLFLLTLKKIIILLFLHTFQYKLIKWAIPYCLIHVIMFLSVVSVQRNFRTSEQTLTRQLHPHFSHIPFQHSQGRWHSPQSNYRLYGAENNRRRRLWWSARVPWHQKSKNSGCEDSQIP